MAKVDQTKIELAVLDIKHSVAEIHAISRAVDTAEGLEDILFLPYTVPVWLDLVESKLNSALVELGYETA